MMKKPRSQIAVIITFVIAAIILFIVVFINITKVSTIKTSSSQGADRAALSLASQIGSMSHYYAHTVLEDSMIDGKPEKCGALWKELGSELLSKAIPGYTPSTPMTDSISNQFNTMSNFNALRESALVQAATSLQTDDVILLPKPAEPGVFYEDVNNNGAFDTGEPQYDLKAIPQMHKQNKVDRFSAWYYTKRFPLVSDEGLKIELNTFISRLKDFVDVDKWDSTEWNIKKASYTIEPAASAFVSPKYDVTCTSITPCASGDTTCTQCPNWVADLVRDRIRVVTIDKDDRDSNDNYNPTGGFLKDKFISLAEDIEKTDDYDLTFCAPGGLLWLSKKCGDINKLIAGLTEFLGKTKELFDLPLSVRLKDVRGTWFSRFYDFEKHSGTGEDFVDTNHNGVYDFGETFTDTNGNKVYDGPRSSIDGELDHDIYLRLTRDQNYINTWITELSYIDNGTGNPNSIRNIIPQAKGHNQYGKGGTKSSCYIAICHAESCSTYCCGSYDGCSFEGTFCSACDSATPPVCVNGDLYGSKPGGWCPLPDRSANCACACNPTRDNQCFEQCSFQGQLVKDNEGPTEVAQAVGILRALNDDIDRIKMTIAQFADKVEQLAPKEDAVRNQLVYAWKDKSGYSHLVSVKIEGKDDAGNVTGYPNKDLPRILETKEEDTLFNRCWILDNYEGNFKITTSRYDQDIDISTPQWKLRRRKPTTEEFDTTKLDAIVADIQDNGEINTTQAYVDDIVSNYAITSTSQAHYGFEKSDIYIMKTEGD